MQVYPLTRGESLPIVEMALVWKVLQEDPQCPGSGGREKVPRVRFDSDERLPSQPVADEVETQ